MEENTPVQVNLKRLIRDKFEILESNMADGTAVGNNGWFLVRQGSA